LDASYSCNLYLIVICINLPAEALEKEKFSQLYTTLSNNFVTRLHEYDFCIILGYSFRDTKGKE